MFYPVMPPVVIKSEKWLEDFFLIFFVDVNDAFFEKLYTIHPQNEQRLSQLFTLMQNKPFPIGCFTGAGISKPYDMPTWGEFMHDAAQQMGGTTLIEKSMSEWDFPQAAQILEDLDNVTFEKIIRATFSHRQIAPELLGIGAVLPFLPFQYLITTNFDNVLEAIYQLAGITIKPVIYGANPAFAKAAHEEALIPLLKIHGDYLHDRILTKTQYEHSYSAQSLLANHLVELFSSISFLFVGFSLQDEDIKIALKKAREKSPDIQHFVILPVNKDVQQQDAFFLDIGVTPIWYDVPHQNATKILGVLVHSLRPDLYLFRIALALKNRLLGDVALPYCQTLLQERPNCYASKMAYAICLANSIDYTKTDDVNYVHLAVGTVDRAIGTVSEFPEAYMIRGHLNYMRLFIDEAIADFTTALEQDIIYRGEVYAFRALCHLGGGQNMHAVRADSQSALDYMGQAGAENDLIVSLMFNIAFIDFMKGDKTAIKTLRGIIKKGFFNDKDMRAARILFRLTLAIATLLSLVGLLKPCLRLYIRIAKPQLRRGARFAKWIVQAGFLKFFIKKPK